MSSSFKMLSAALIIVTGASSLASGAYAAAHKGGGDISVPATKATRDTNPAPTSPTIGSCASGAQFWEMQQHDNTVVMPCTNTETRRHVG
jgi:hypothetical protein